MRTYTMVQDILWKADCHSACQKYPAIFMEPKCSLSCSQKQIFIKLGMKIVVLFYHVLIVSFPVSMRSTKQSCILFT